MVHRKRERSPQMRRRKEQNTGNNEFYTPFIGLDQHLGKKTKNKRVAKSAQGEVPRLSTRMVPPSEYKKPVQEEILFREAMSGVKPMKPGRERVPLRPQQKISRDFLEEEEMEVKAYLRDLVEGEIRFELTHSDEYVDGAISGLSPGILRSLRNGDYSYQEYIDLHGCTSAQAQDRVIKFVEQGFWKGHRCVLIVSGRGLNSRDKEPVIKRGVIKWLTRAPLKRLVLAFTSARSHDGGAGAFYVLLRRNPGRSTVLSPAR